MTQITVNGNTYSDDGTSARDMQSGGFRTNFLPMISDTMVAVSAQVTAAAAQVSLATGQTTAATNQAQAAATSAATAASAPGTSATSTTTLTIGMGAQSLTIQTGKSIVPGMQVVIANTAAPTNWMAGTVTAYNSATGALAVTATNINGTATGVSAWTISLAGAPGVTGVLNELKGASIASAATVALDSTTGNFIHITGSVAITGFTLAAGATRTVVFDGSPLLTHNAAATVLPGAANIQAQPGDAMILRGDGSGVVKCVDYIRANGYAVVSPMLAPWGDGSDGNVTISGSVTLTRDMFYNNLTITGSGALVTNGYRVFVAGTLDISAASTGAISWNGQAGNAGASGNAAGTGGAARTGLTSANLGGSPASGSGGVGGTGSGVAGSPGGSGSPGNNGGSVSTAGLGGNGNTGTGGSAGVGTNNSYKGISLTNTPLGTYLNGIALALLLGGASGPGGGGGGGTDGGGGGSGGSGAGVIVIVANVIYRGTNTNTGIIQAIGGNAGLGGAGYSSGIGGGGGGGSGGGGGVVVVIFGSLTGSAIASAIDISGGAGANGGSAFTGSVGGNGGPSGGSGTVYLYNIGTMLLTVTMPVAGAPGTTTTTTAAGIGAAANTQRVTL